MIYDLKPYPAYRDSGVSWLGEVPAHWKVARSRYLFREIDQRSQTGAEPHLSMSQKLGLVPSAMVEQQTLVSESYIGGKLCEEDDLVLNRLKAHLGVFALAKQSGVVSPDYTVLRRIRTMAVRYFEHMLRSPACRWELRVRAKGIVEGFWRLYTDDFYDIRLPVPPEREQLDVIHFLDHVDHRIRRYIRAKKELIALLNEQKMTIIHHAVTRGLDPNVRFKDSGVEWLGEMPEHWGIVALGRLIELKTGFPFKSEGFSQNADDIRLLRGVNVAPGRIRWDNLVRWSVSQREEFSRYELCEGDLVLGMDRPVIRGGVRIAKIGAADLPALVLQRVARIRPRLNLEADFALLLLSGKSFADYLAPIFTGISVPHISPEQIKGFRIALPAVEEQLAIVRSIQRNTSILDSSVNVAIREIELLGEYRTRLVTDVVTGKLDVREAAARLPEEVEEPEEEMAEDAEADDTYFSDTPEEAVA